MPLTGVGATHSLSNSVSQWPSVQTESVAFKCPAPGVLLQNESDGIIHCHDHVLQRDSSCSCLSGFLQVSVSQVHFQPVEDMCVQWLQQPRHLRWYDHCPDMCSCSRTKDPRGQVRRECVEEHDRLIGFGNGFQRLPKHCHQASHQSSGHPSVCSAQDTDIRSQ